MRSLWRLRLWAAAALTNAASKSFLYVSGGDVSLQISELFYRLYAFVLPYVVIVLISDGLRCCSYRRCLVSCWRWLQLESRMMYHAWLVSMWHCYQTLVFELWWQFEATLICNRRRSNILWSPDVMSFCLCSGSELQGWVVQRLPYCLLCLFEIPKNGIALIWNLWSLSKFWLDNLLRLSYIFIENHHFFFSSDFVKSRCKMPALC